MTTGRVPMGIQLVASLHWRSMSEGVAETIVTCAMSFTIEMHAVRLRIGAESGSVMSSARIETMTIMVLSMTNLTDSAPHKGGHIPGGVKAYS
jgi:hypothetical protein